jgi:hypothetical protein
MASEQMVETAIMTTSAATSFINIGGRAAGRVLRLPLEGGGRNATGLARLTQRTTEAPTGELSPMAFLVGVGVQRARQTPPPDAPNELAPQGACAERLAQVGGANSWRVFLPPRGGGVRAVRAECNA